MTVLRADLLQLSEEIKGYALEYGLDFIPVNFELVDYRQMNQIAACSGFPSATLRFVARFAIFW